VSAGADLAQAGEGRYHEGTSVDHRFGVGFSVAAQRDRRYPVIGDQADGRYGAAGVAAEVVVEPGRRDRLAGDRELTERPLVSWSKGILGLVAIAMSSASRRGIPRARKSSIGWMRASWSCGDLKQICSMRNSSMGPPPFSAAYSDSTPLPRPESAYTVKALSVRPVPPLILMPA
jgi:hypothetical protein